MNVMDHLDNGHAAAHGKRAEERDPVLAVDDRIDRSAMAEQPPQCGRVDAECAAAAADSEAVAFARGALAFAPSHDESDARAAPDELLGDALGEHLGPTRLRMLQIAPIEHRNVDYRNPTLPGFQIKNIDTQLSRKSSILRGSRTRTATGLFSMNTSRPSQSKLLPFP